MRAVVLLEVLLSMGLLIFAFGMVGSQMISALDMAERNDREMRTAMMIDMVVSELNGRRIRLAEPGEEMPDEERTGHFGLKFPGYTWRITVEDTDMEGIYQLYIEIGYNEADAQDQIDTPEFREIEFENHDKVVDRTYRLWSMPAKIDLLRDYGMEESDLTKMLGALGAAGLLAGEGDMGGEGMPDGAGGGDGMPDPNNPGDGNGGGAPEWPSDGEIDFDMLQQFMPEGVDAQELFELLTQEGGFDPAQIVDVIGEGGGDFAGKIQELLGDQSIRDLMRGDFLKELQNTMNGGGREGREGGRDGANRPGRGGRRGDRNNDKGDSDENASGGGDGPDGPGGAGPRRPDGGRPQQ